MYVLDTNPRCAVILHPKTGTRSLERVLRPLSCSKAVKGRHGIDEKELAAIRSEGGIVAGTIRNPFDVLVSWYHYKWNNRQQLSRGFEAYARQIMDTGNGYIKPGQPMFYGSRWMNWTLRFESGLDSELDHLFDVLGLDEPSKLEHIGAAQARSRYQDYYTEETFPSVMERFRSDFEKFDYWFEHVS